MMAETPSLTIGCRTVGVGYPVYVVAEISANHGQDYEQAVALVQAAKKAGADAVKLQTYTADTLTLDCDHDCFQIRHGTVWDGKTLYQLYREAYTPWEWQPLLREEALRIGLECFSTPFDPTAVDFLEAIGVPVHKVASFEVVDIPLLRKIGATRKPVIMSTGMASLAEIDTAVRTLRSAGAPAVALLKCTSAYPAVAAEMNLLTIPHLAEAFHCPAGLSDHTLDIAVPVVAVTLGACIVEKHLTLRRAAGGPDAAFSLEPEEFRLMVEAVHAAEAAVGKVCYEPTEHEAANRAFRRSLFVARDIKAGDTFTTQNVRSVRPAHGLPPVYFDTILGRRAKCDMTRGTPLTWESI